jgi:class 3 adenylate cyclase/predicted ATPase
LQAEAQSARHALDHPAATAEFVPYVPRLVIEWLASEPEVRHRDVEGSIAFVDISGFTALSERLARRGKVGAEQLVDTIGTCFSELLATAYAHGGGLLKFGGDALLLLFTGAEHEVRASNAAIAMRRSLRENGSFDVDGIRVSLRMSVGVNSGVFQLFLVGKSHRELILTGPAASATVALEASADAGEIVASPRTVAALPLSAVGAAKGEGRLLRRGVRLSPTSMDAAPTPVEVPADVHLSRCVSVALRESLLATVREPEHRRVAIAFVHFDGTDALIEARGADWVTIQLESLVGVVQQAVERYAVTFVGTDIDSDGGKIILVAGAPTSSGGDERRMLLALRELVEAPLQLPVRVGVHRGAVFAGDIGPWYRRTYTVMGDAVNLAARLMAKARPGEILATHDVVDRANTEFAIEKMEPFLVKGKRDPIDAVHVGPVVRAQRHDVAPAVPLVGRRTEVGAMRAAVTRARNGRGELIRIIGGPGLGKTRLVHELRNEASEFTHLSTACEPYESTTPYFPWRGLLRDLIPGAMDEVASSAVRALHEAFEKAAPELMPWAPLVATIVDVPMQDTRETTELDPRFRNARLADVLSGLLAGLLPTVTLLTVEDAQWMDDASADLLQRLSQELHGRPWIVCVTRRDEEEVAEDAFPGLLLRLAPLDDAERLEFLNLATEDEPFAPHTLKALSDRSGGNPLFLRELVATTRLGDGVDALPDTIEAVITAHIDRLAPNDRSLLRRASVLGMSFSEEELRAVVDEFGDLDDTAWDRLGDFLRRNGSDGFAFDQALARDCAYEGLSFRLRRQLHARVADVIAASGGDLDAQAEVLSLHYLHAEMFLEAWTFARSAATRAADIYASVEASQLFERALDAGRRLRDLDPREVSAVHEALGDVRDRMGQFAQAQVSYRAVRRLTRGDPVANARLLLKLARVQGWQDRYSQALSYITRGLSAIEDLAGEDAARQRAQLLAWYGRFCLQAGHHRRALEYCRRAIDEAEAAGEKEALADALQISDWAYEDLGQLDLATNWRRALELYEELGNLPGQSSIYNTVGATAYWKGEWPEALEAYERARDTVARTGDAVMYGVCSNNIGEICLDQGRWDEAAELFRDALHAYQASGFRAGIGFAKRNLARLASIAGRHDEAIRLFEESLAATTAVGAHADALETNARLAEALLRSGDAEGALALAETTQSSARSLGGVTILLSRVQGAALAQLGDFAAAQDALRLSLETALARQADYEIALTQRTMARLAARSGAPRDDCLLSDSDALFERLAVVEVTDLLPSG